MTEDRAEGGRDEDAVILIKNEQARPYKKEEELIRLER